MKKPLWIYGAGGLGAEILALARTLDEWEVQGFLDDGEKGGTSFHGIPVKRAIENIHTLPDKANITIAVGSPLDKQRIRARLGGRFTYPILIHPSVIMMDRGTIRVGEGAVITAGCILTTDIDIRDHVLLNLKVTVGHNTDIGSFSSIMPGVNLGGYVSVGEAVLIGSGANVRNNIRIGSRSRVGLGAAVVKNVAEEVTVFGVPAKKHEG